MTYLPKNPAFFSNLDGMQAICAEKMCAEKSSSETPYGCFGTTNKIIFKNVLKMRYTKKHQKIINF